MEPKVIFVILNYNGGEETTACLRSIQGIDYGNHRVIVVDNASTDGSAEKIQKQFPNVRLIRNLVNAGYDGGNNIGIEAALRDGADAVFILNNDTVVCPGILRHLTAAAQNLPRAGILGPKIYYYDDPKPLWWAGSKKKYSVTGWLLMYTQEGKGEVDRGQYDGVGKIDAVNGCAMYIRREVFEEAGAFDARYFIYNDEFDLCHRAQSRGWDCYFVPTAKLWHKVSKSLGGPYSRSLHYLWTRNWLLCSRKQTPFFLWPMLYYAYVKECYWVYFGLREKGQVPAAEGALAGGWAAILNRFGPPPKRMDPPRWVSRLAARRFQKRGPAISGRTSRSSGEQGLREGEDR
ncbi:MAG: glycosyltransferase family 2 protein [Candidatus Aureabacteria bacterium]|nr:glycosyltransferase family 2 protein [Candidatus Auribacterota bacterium]